MRATDATGQTQTSAYADPAPFIRHFLSAQYAEMIGRYKEAFLRALPQLSRQEPYVKRLVEAFMLEEKGTGN